MLAPSQARGSRGPPPCSSIDLSRLFIFVQGVLNHLPYQLTPKNQLRSYVPPINQLPPQVTNIDLCKRQEVSMPMYKLILCCPVTIRINRIMTTIFAVFNLMAVTKEVTEDLTIIKLFGQNLQV